MEEAEFTFHSAVMRSVRRLQRLTPLSIRKPFSTSRGFRAEPFLLDETSFFSKIETYRHTHASNTVPTERYLLLMPRRLTVLPHTSIAMMHRAITASIASVCNYSPGMNSTLCMDAGTGDSNFLLGHGMRLLHHSTASQLWQYRYGTLSIRPGEHVAVDGVGTVLCSVNFNFNLKICIFTTMAQQPALWKV